jgi:hypothetical protein
MTKAAAYKMETVAIDDAPEAVAEMLTRGAIHAHQDGAWRFSEWGKPSAYINDPTANFPHRATFANGRAAMAHPGLGIFAVHYSDGTRGIYTWDRNTTLLWQLYGARDEGERQEREWLRNLMQPDA